MKTLIVEDDFTCRTLLHELLKDLGTTHIAVNGKEAINAVKVAMESGAPYQLICMDIVMPEMDGQSALKEIRFLEEENGIASTQGAKIIMITSQKNYKNVSGAFSNLCDRYLIKPIGKKHLIRELATLGIIA